MAKFGWFSYVLFVSFISSMRLIRCGATEERKVYVVYMGALRRGEHYSPFLLHFNMLREVVGSSFLEQSFVRSYSKSFNAFAAYLTEQERQLLANYDGVVSIFPSRTLYPQTTRSWDFMGFSENVTRNSAAESNVIIGVIDTGIWPESESFSDEGFGPPPVKWKGTCRGGQNFTCNNKIIGARYYNSESPEDDTARDTIGHGTHTASTAAGNNVKGASFYGLAQGTSRGGVPSARIAAYKVCHPDAGCIETDLLAAFDDAIADGVDIITISIGGASASDFIDDSIAIGAFHAMEKGILTVNSAGNQGFTAGLTSSVAPWMLSVAASSTDRHIINKVVLGNGKTLVGNAIDSFVLNGPQFPLIYGNHASTDCFGDDQPLCTDDCLDRSLVKGKIVLCDKVSGAQEALKTGALGAITPTGEAADVSSMVPLPSSLLNSGNIDLVHGYINSTIMPQANIFKSESIKNFSAPVVASFSSKGPNEILPEILKPDITAPGVEILAAYSPAASVTGDPLDKRSATYSILSGTSMACPHVAGAAAYVKTMRPHWSPSAIKSALMTTAWPMNATKHPEAEFAYGAGHISPLLAVDPGLVYETSTEDYIKLLCTMKYSESTIRNLFGSNISCPRQTKVTAKDLNYPTMAAQVESDGSFTIKFPRTVTNVGLSNSTYKPIIGKTSSLNIGVEPEVLYFKSAGEKKSFVVTVSGSGLNGMVTDSLVWSDGIHSVRSPIVVHLDMSSLRD